MLDSKAYNEYYDVASGAEPPKAKTKYKKKADEPITSSKSKTAPASKGSRLKSSTKVAKTTKKKKPAMMPKTKGLDALSEVALSKVEQIKLATKRNKKDFHMSHATGSGAGVRPKVLDVPKYASEIDEESWRFSQDEDDADKETDVNDDSEETASDNDGDDLTHLNFDVVTLKRGRDDQDKDEDPSAGSNRGSQLKSSGKSAQAEEHGQTVDDLEEQTHQEFNTGNDDVTLVREALYDDESQWNPSSSSTPYCEWHKTKTVDNRPPQPWITQMAQTVGLSSSPIMLSKGRSLVYLLACSELGAAVCTTVVITSEEEDSESFSGIGMPKDRSLFMYATFKS
nr:hypothetical protein [Tanacetum cinerariifolium]